MSIGELIGALRWSTVKRELGIRLANRRRRRWQLRNLDQHAPKRPVFVTGLQRSGTNMVMWTLERCPAAWVYHEHRWNPAFVDFRLRPTATIQQLIDDCSASVVAFKPVCDSHLIDRFLDRHPNSRAIWIYRGYRDVANSALRNFGEHQRDLMGWIAHGDFDIAGWRAERVTTEMVETARRFYRDGMPVEAAGAFAWYYRNLFFFEQGLDRDDRVLVVRYEDLVQGDERPFRRLFEFVGLPFDPSYLEDIFSSSVGKNPFPDIDPELAALCDNLTQRFDAVRERQEASTAAENPSPA